MIAEVWTKKKLRTFKNRIFHNSHDDPDSDLLVLLCKSSGKEPLPVAQEAQVRFSDREFKGTLA